MEDGPSFESSELSATLENNPNLPVAVMGSSNTEWTDEKHSLYIENMEASFVNQLYSSMDMLASDRKSSRKLQFGNHPTGEVLNNGCWQKINFTRAERQLNRTDEACSLLENSWIQHFRSAEKSQVVTPLTIQESSQPTCGELKEKGMEVVGSSSSPKPSRGCRSHLCTQDMFGTNTEVSDQNFIDENLVEEKGSGIHSVKRLKSCG